MVRLCATGICGSDLHLYLGTIPGMKPGQVMGHEVRPLPTASCFVVILLLKHGMQIMRMPACFFAQALSSERQATHCTAPDACMPGFCMELDAVTRTKSQ